MQNIFMQNYGFRVRVTRKRNNNAYRFLLQLTVNELFPLGIPIPMYVLTI